MADFSVAYRKMRIIEGGWTDKPNETYAGVDRKHHPQWGGWSIIDEVKRTIPGPRNRAWVKKLNAILRKHVLLESLLNDFYRQTFWPAIYNTINNQSVADYVFDKAVNMGPKQIHKFVQRVLKIKDDGIFGKETLFHVNAADPASFLKELDIMVDQFYEYLVRKDPNNKGYINGWKKR